MLEVALLSSLLTQHHPSHWTMTCQEWNNNRAEIISDDNHTPDAKEYLIDYFYSKVEDKNCKPMMLGRK
jgi:hypothetical protein